jgi:hypothetical protein
MLMAPHVISGHQGSKVVSNTLDRIFFEDNTTKMTSSDCTIALFKPKTVLGSPLAGIQLVAVLVKPGNQLGPASSLTKKLRFKDTPAAGDKWIMTVLNKPSKAEGPFLPFLCFHSLMMTLVNPELTLFFGNTSQT